jgi:ParB/RepB/Spo0J family partition protein
MNSEPQMFADVPATPAADVSSQPASETASEILLRQATKAIIADPSIATVDGIKKALKITASKSLDIIYKLEEAGIVAPYDKSKVDAPRKLLITELPKWAGGDLAKPRPDKCPTCDSPAAHLHRAMQFEGDVQPCEDPWHNDTNRTLPVALEQQTKDTTEAPNGKEFAASLTDIRDKMIEGVRTVLGPDKKPVDFYRPETAGKAETAGEPREQITYIPLTKLFPSQTPTQVMRRANFSPAAITELANSLKAQGLLQPLLVRPRPGSWEEAGEFEIVAGERRWLACKEAGIQSDVVPCIVRKLTDAQVMELQLVENLQREGTHPLEEAAGYRALLELRSDGAEKDEKASVAYISQRVGKSVSYIFQRLKLLALSEETKEAFQAGELSPSHALDCARLEPRDQAGYLQAFRANGSDLSPSVRQMREWIARYARIDLARAPFNLKDGKLLEGVPACSACPKCSIAQAELFADFTEQASPAAKRKKGEKATALCMDPTCYGRKLTAFAAKTGTTREAFELVVPEDRPQNAYLVKLDDYTPRGVELRVTPAGQPSVFELLKPGDVVRTNYESGPYVVDQVNFEEEYKLPTAGLVLHNFGEKARKGQESFISELVAENGRILHLFRNNSAEVLKITEAEAQAILDERAKQRGAGTTEIRKEQQRRLKEKWAREHAFKQICRSLAGHTQSTEDLRDIASAFYASLHYDNQKALAKLLGWKKANTRDLDPADVIAGASRGYLQALLLKCALVGEVIAPHLEPELLEAVGTRYGVSLKELRKPQPMPKEKKSKPTAEEQRMSPTARKRLSELRELRAIAKSKPAPKGAAKKKARAK